MGYRKFSFDTKTIVDLQSWASSEQRSILMPSYFSLFWWTYASLSLVGILLIVMYISDAEIDLVYLFKVPLIITFLILVAFHTKNRLRFSPITLLFGYFGIVGVLIGAIEGTLLTKPALVHLYMISMSIMGCSFGYWMAAKYDVNMQRMIHRVMSFIFCVSVITLSAYFYFHFIAKSIAYFGFDSYLPLVSAMFLADKKYILLAIAFILVVFSGKRAPLIAMLTPVLIMQINVLIRPRLKKLFTNFVIVVFLIAGGGFIITQTDLANRWELIASTDITNLDSIHVATSGRSVELFGLWNHMSDSLVRWFIGSGIGGQFTIEAVFREELINREQHYLHLAIMTYLLVFGAPFLLFLLGYITYVFWRNRRNFSSFFYIGMLVTFVGSLFGAGLIVEPIFWVFLGANQYSINSAVHKRMRVA